MIHSGESMALLHQNPKRKSSIISWFVSFTSVFFTQFVMASLPLFFPTSPFPSLIPLAGSTSFQFLLIMFHNSFISSIALFLGANCVFIDQWQFCSLYLFWVWGGSARILLVCGPHPQLMLSSAFFLLGLFTCLRFVKVLTYCSEVVICLWFIELKCIVWKFTLFVWNLDWWVN